MKADLLNPGNDDTKVYTAWPVVILAPAYSIGPLSMVTFGNYDPRDPELPRGARLPLNSKRLTAVHLRVIAKAMDLTTTGSADQLRKMIKGKLQTDDGGHVGSTLVI